MAHGTPARPADIEAFYTEIRRGRPPTAEQLADLERRYGAIGGVSPLAERTRAQAAGIQLALHQRDDAPPEVSVELGQKFADPRIEDGVAALAAAGVTDVVGVVLAPHHSELSVAEYLRRAEGAAVGAGIEFSGIRSFGEEPELVELLARRVERARRDTKARVGEGAAVELLVTAHSLPERCLELDDPTYPEQLAATGAAVAAASGTTSWRVAWQSAGRTPEPWLGPDLLTVLRELPGEGRRAAIVCPAGFTSDHLEVLYDIDIEAQAVAADAGLVLTRTESLNDDPGFCALIARLVAESIRESEAGR